MIAKSLSYLCCMIKETLKDIRALTRRELAADFNTRGFPSFRTTQVFEWLWKKSARSFNEMSNIPESMRKMLEEEFMIRSPDLVTSQVSYDKTIKCVFKLFDSNVIESVLIPANDRMTACVSSQVGCSLSCKFCATGKLERVRNLTPGEIYDQVVEIGRLSDSHYQTNLTNIVFMGMGEPLLNYSNVIRAIEMITSPDGLHMSPRRITVSTAGIAKMIRKMGDDEVKFNLALSLHAANDDKRSGIMPINEHNSLDVLREALIHFHQKTGTRVTYEYIVFRDFNDEITDARELAQFCKHVPCKVNLIEYNPIDGGDYKNAREDKLEKFRQFLESRNIIVNVRRSRGKDIDAACGQLANKSAGAGSFKA
jgi:23S rRNA (adenine2503-C2)-methyltransferase